MVHIVIMFLNSPVILIFFFPHPNRDSVINSCNLLVKTQHNYFLYVFVAYFCCCYELVLICFFSLITCKQNKVGIMLLGVPFLLALTVDIGYGSIAYL